MSKNAPLITALAAAVALVLLGGLVTHLTGNPAGSVPEAAIDELRAPLTPQPEETNPDLTRFAAREAEYRARLEEANRRLREQGAALEEARRRLESANRPSRAAPHRDDEHEAREARDADDDRREAEHAHGPSARFAWVPRPHREHHDD